MNEKLKSVFNQPSTWRGLVNLSGAVSLVVAPFLEKSINSKIEVGIGAATFLVTGLIGMTTDDKAVFKELLKRYLQSSDVSKQNEFKNQ